MKYFLYRIKENRNWKDKKAFDRSLISKCQHIKKHFLRSIYTITIDTDKDVSKQLIPGQVYVMEFESNSKKSKFVYVTLKSYEIDTKNSTITMVVKRPC